MSNRLSINIIAIASTCIEGQYTMKVLKERWDCNWAIIKYFCSCQSRSMDQSIVPARLKYFSKSIIRVVLNCCFSPAQLQ